MKKALGSHLVIQKPLPRVDAPIFVAVTGGSGSGKSSLCKHLQLLGANVVSADAVARELMAPHTPLTAKVINHFGSEISDQEGVIDRQKLGALIFGNEQAKLELNAITHPVIRAESMRQLAAATADIRVYDVPLLLEADAGGEFDVVVTVTSPASKRIERIVARDGVSAPAAIARLNSQFPESALVAAAHILVDNVGERVELEHSALELHRILGRLLKNPVVDQRG